MRVSITGWQDRTVDRGVECLGRSLDTPTGAVGHHALRHQRRVQLLQQWVEVGAEELPGFAEAAVVGERGEVEVVALDPQAGGDVVADILQPAARR